VPTTETATSVRGRHRAAISAGVATVAGVLCVGGSVAFAMANASASPVSTSAPWSGPALGAPAATTSATTSGVTTSPLPGSAQSGGAPAPATAGGVVSTVHQTLGMSVLPGSLTVNPTAVSVALTTLGAAGHSTSLARGDLSPITVDDARGSLVGWRATVSLQAVSGLDAAQLASTRLCVSPHPTTLVAGNPADIVRSSPRACAGPGDPIAVFFAAPGGGGGEYSDTADIALALPDGASASGATASLAVSVS
jgi:hypothetical protein